MQTILYCCKYVYFRLIKYIDCHKKLLSKFCHNNEAYFCKVYIENIFHNIIKVYTEYFFRNQYYLAITAHDMTSRKLFWQVEHWHFSIQVMKTIFLTWYKRGSDKDGSNSGGSDEEFDDSKNDFSTDGCSDCSSY